MKSNIYILKFFIIIVACVLKGCLSNSSNHFQESINIVSDQFEDSLFNHFPSSIDVAYRLQFISPEKCKENGRCGVFLITTFPNDKINLLRDELIKNGYLITRFSDTSNFILLPESRNEHRTLESVPIPNFPEILNNSKLLIKQKVIDITKFEIIVLDAKPGIFINEDLLSNNPNLPKVWKNGYNKGIALNSDESEIIYWFEVW